MPAIFMIHELKSCCILSWVKSMFLIKFNHFSIIIYLIRRSSKELSLNNTYNTMLKKLLQIATNNCVRIHYSWPLSNCTFSSRAANVKDMKNYRYGSRKWRLLSTTYSIVTFAGIERRRHGVNPRKNRLHPPSSTYNFLMHSWMPANLRREWSDSSDCIEDLMTSVGYVMDQ